MDYLTILFSYIVIGIIVSILVSFVNLIAKPVKDIKKYSLWTGLVLSTLVITAYNMGVMTTLQIPIEGVSVQPYFHYVDIGFTSLLGVGGAKGYHEIIKKLSVKVK